MKNNSYCPKKGDLITLAFDPQSGKEQKGRRPALVISNTLFNEKTGLAIVCPLTKTDRKIPFHIKVDENEFVTGFVMTEQIKSVDFVSRKAKFLYRPSLEMLQEVLAVLHACVF
ncbi:MAG: type II toxin-antitoxin system PemK/MazF family toxin [Candidatus Omnitrophica bacterium]|nr:type II toxin-antitoxin system PemK/MazF family toxin [Candidatus Omnitrophota bacterium]MBU1997253.1 type II toxin-antitoxin system PemK/MazF family toxin [Candidatus Omnitrophota bacterium]MBU4334629.1 type II toxin-antitoxin system PemK/MazF family toxin [Candidatus Omnitrophota bacterium]